LVVVRKSGCWSLANAFEKPIRPTRENGLIENSMVALDAYWKNLIDVYGDEQILTKNYFTLSGEDLPNLNGARVKSKKELIERTRQALEQKGA
jgi:CRISPR system Cascade subunit CasC